MTDITDSRTIGSEPEVQHADPAAEPHILPDPLPPAEIVQAAETAHEPLPEHAEHPDADLQHGEPEPGEAALAAPEPEQPDEPRTFPYDLASPELERAFLHARTPRAWTDRPIDEETLPPPL